jgi:hypothetical protein
LGFAAAGALVQAGVVSHADAAAGADLVSSARFLAGSKTLSAAATCACMHACMHACGTHVCDSKTQMSCSFTAVHIMHPHSVALASSIAIQAIQRCFTCCQLRLAQTL